MSISVNQTLMTADLRRVMQIAEGIARDNMHQKIQSPHLLIALLHKDAGLQNVFQVLNKDIYYLQEWAEVRMEALPKSTSRIVSITEDDSLEQIRIEAESIRMRTTAGSLEPIHILAALSTAGVAFNYEQLKTFPLSREELLNLVSTPGKSESIVNPFADNNGRAAKRGNQIVDKYCKDKTLLVQQGKADTIVGRDEELRMIAEILCRRSKANVMIVGEPGVGKSALVHAFAMCILKQKVSDELRKSKIFELDIGALIAGATYRGEIEDRLRNTVSEIKQIEGAILFIDEIHVLLDKNGTYAGAANILKPELARGDLTVIGATTLEDFRKVIEPDKAFSRRFETLIVEEPDFDTCFQMLKTVMPYYESYHRILVPDGTIRETIRLAKRYVQGKKLPDSAIDLADRSMAALRTIDAAGKKDIEEIKTIFEEWSHDDARDSRHSVEDWKWLISQCRHRISPILWANSKSKINTDTVFDADNLKDYLNQVINAFELEASRARVSLEKADVAAIVSNKTGIPIGKVQSEERERYLSMETILKKRVIGQDHAVMTITDAVLDSRTGLNKPGQPIGSFFFLGPTGTGKTELAKALAEFLFQQESSIIRFDMSEFKEEHAAALLYGSPPGYVGYEEGGLLVNKIRQRPYSVVLFDEIEKAHASVFDVFLQIMDEGKLHDKLGREGDFSNAIIIFTSNIGSQYISESKREGGLPASNKLLEVMSRYFRPEFLGRLTGIVPFAPINERMVAEILAIQIRELLERLEKQGIHLKVSETAITRLAHSGYSKEYGARQLQTLIRSELRRPLSRKIISGEITNGDVIELTTDEKGELLWKNDNDTSHSTFGCSVPK